MYNAYGKLVMNVQYICALCFDVHNFFFLLPAFFCSASLILKDYGDMEKTDYVAERYGEWVHYQN